MSDQEHGSAGGDPMEKLLGGMHQDLDGQFGPLGFGSQDALNWTGRRYHVQPPLEQYQQSYDFLGANRGEYYDYGGEYTILGGVSEAPSAPNTKLIENLVGNWVVPNTSGTYSPFGNSDSFLSNVFDRTEVVEDLKYKAEVPEDARQQFAFNREPTRKPRMVAEVKPMRPSYSDVLTKAVPTPPNKQATPTDKTPKPKNNNKRAKNHDKSTGKTPIIRSNTNNDIREIPGEKPAPNQSKPSEKTAPTKNKPQLSRRWASLDNISEPKPKIDERKKETSTKPTLKMGALPVSARRINNKVEVSDVESTIKPEASSSGKNGLKKKPAMRLVRNDSTTPTNKRNTRTRKRENQTFGVFGQKVQQYVKSWWKIVSVFLIWLYNLISDIFTLSLHLSRDLGTNVFVWLKVNSSELYESTSKFVRNIRLFSWLGEKLKGGAKKTPPEEDTPTFAPNGLHNNITMPTTGDEAMKRLLACKGKDPYSILGVTPGCSDDDIKRYYKRQAFLVHPDKNQQPGAEEAFKILVHAFDMIGEPERRASYDRGVVESAQVKQAWHELTELLQQLQQKVEAAANTIRCSACGSKHKRIKIERPSYAARNCNSCKIHHAAREGDIWAEARVFGFLWHYYACMEGGVYDITAWAACQKDNLKHLKPDCHNVQYRIALGKQSQQGARRQQATPTTRSDRPDLENLLNTLYGHGEQGGGAGPGNNPMSNHSRQRRGKKTK